jgi:hypothetical protein
MLLPIQPATNGADILPTLGKVTYVLDQGLVNFGKFAGAVLGIFLVVGAYLYGFKLDNALGKVQEQQGELTKLLGAVRTSKARVDSAEQQLQNSMQKVQVLEKSFEDSIAQKQSRATAFYVSQQLTFTQQSRLSTVQAQQPELFRRGTSFWPMGSALRIKFLDGPAAQRKKVKEIISRWFTYANLNFQFVTVGATEVRISFAGKRDGYWSYLGTDARAIAQDKPTINFGEGWQHDETIVLREFGHALGLVTEFQNPNANIPWNKKAVYAEFESPPNLWSREIIQAQFFAKASVEKVGSYRPFDPNSVMMYQIAYYLTDGKVVPKIHGLSPSDKALIARIYPRR